MVAEILEAAGLPQYTISISHRKLLEGLARQVGVPDILAPTVYRAVDKLAKIGHRGVRAELTEAGISGEASDRLLDALEQTGGNQDVIDKVRRQAASDSAVASALDNLAEIFLLLEALAPGKDCFKLDLTLARGLDYYTGIVYEATVDEPKVGSVSGGGRYDELVGMFSGRDIPAMGISIGLERIIEVAEEFQLVTAPKSVCDAIVVLHDDVLPYAAEIARSLREQGLNVDLSLLGHRSFGDQLKYADRRGIPVAVLIGESEPETGQATVKNLASGEQWTVTQGEIGDIIIGLQNR
jgi:histidyl-tRNA synthetase